MKLFKQLIYITGLLSLITFVAAKSEISKYDLNSEWALDTAKSDFGNLTKEEAAPTLIVLKQEEKSITFDRKFYNMPTIPQETLPLDGKEMEIRQSGYTIKRTLHLSEDKLTITVNSKYHMTPEGQEPWDYTRTETYALANDGKSMLLTRRSILPDRQEVVKAFYNKVTTK